MRHGAAKARGAGEAAALVAPGIAVLLLAFFWPVGEVLVLSLLEPAAPGAPRSVGLGQYAKFFADDYYLTVAARTFRLALIITAITLVLGFPLAYLMARARPALRFWLMALTVLPLMTSVVIRTFGWLVILGRGGALDRTLQALGFGSSELLHTETGIVVAMVQVLLPFMAFTVMGVIARIDPRLEEAARVMGAGFFGVLRRVVIPLSLPGIVAGCLLTFALAISSFITPTLVGGVRIPVMAGSIYSLVTGTQDWPLGAALSTMLLAATLAIIVPYALIMRRRWAAA